MNNDTHGDGAVYQAKICDQYFERNPGGQLRLVLTTKINGKLRNEQDPGSGVNSVEEFERYVWITFPEDPHRLGIAMGVLQQLGFDQADVAKLHPDNPDFFSLVGTEVYVLNRVHNGVIYWNFTWPNPGEHVIGLEETSAKAAKLEKVISRAPSNFPGVILKKSKKPRRKASVASS